MKLLSAIILVILCWANLSYGVDISNYNNHRAGLSSVIWQVVVLQHQSREGSDNFAAYFPASPEEGETEEKSTKWFRKSAIIQSEELYCYYTVYNPLNQPKYRYPEYSCISPLALGYRDDNGDNILLLGQLAEQAQSTLDFLVKNPENYLLPRLFSLPIRRTREARKHNVDFELRKSGNEYFAVAKVHDNGWPSWIEYKIKIGSCGAPDEIKAMESQYRGIKFTASVPMPLLFQSYQKICKLQLKGHDLQIINKFKSHLEQVINN